MRFKRRLAEYIGRGADAATALITITPSATIVQEITDSETGILTIYPAQVLFDTTAIALIKITPSANVEQPIGVSTNDPIPPVQLPSFPQLPTDISTASVSIINNFLDDVRQELRALWRSQPKRPVIPVYDPLNFPQDVIPGQIAVGKDGTFNFYRRDGSWGKFAS